MMTMGPALPTFYNLLPVSSVPGEEQDREEGRDTTPGYNAKSGEGSATGWLRGQAVTQSWHLICVTFSRAPCGHSSPPLRTVSIN